MTLTASKRDGTGRPGPERPGAALRKAALLAGVAMVAGLPVAATAQDKPLTKIVVFDGPSVDHDGVWMAIDKGLYKEAGLDVQTRIFPSGTAAFQSFSAGEGDILMGGELAALSHWRNSVPDYRIILDMERNSTAYIAVADKAIEKPEDLKGKIIGVLKGASGDWFLSEYLSRNGIDPADVTVKNLTNPVLPVALCNNDVQAIFSWEPRGTRSMEICGDKIHYLSNATGYMQGYNLAGARSEWLESPEGRDAAMRFVAATMKGAEIAENDLDAVKAYAEKVFGMSETDVTEQYKDLNRTLAFDQTFFDDFCSISKWAQANDVITGESNLADFVWTDGVAAVDPSLVVAAPPPC